MPPDRPTSDPTALDVILAREGDRRLDARVSEQVMGEPALEHEGDYLALRQCVCKGRSGLPRSWAGHWFACVEDLPRYTVRMDAAWRVVQVMARRVGGGAPWRLEKRDEGWATVGPDGRVLASAPSAPLCICRAAVLLCAPEGATAD